MGNIPSVSMWMSDYTYTEVTWVTPPVIEYPNTINKFVFETLGWWINLVWQSML